ncbi:MAG: lytic transglycosylase domain-containing protein [Oscillospiraceae bacterium]|nr:lytic transglycosylase domain-containing protein [Oscillospiraceae bacterium]
MKTKKKRSGGPLRALLSVILALTVMLLGVRFTFAPTLRYFYPLKYREIVEKYSAEYGVDEFLVYAFIHTESGFDPKAESHAGARGLMQLMEDTFEWVDHRMGDEGGASYEDIEDPEICIRYGTYLLRLLMDEYNDIPTAAAAYHAGRGQVNKWLADPAYSSDGSTLENTPSAATNHYIHKITSACDVYTRLYGE